MDERIPAEVQKLMKRQRIASLNELSDTAGVHTTTVSRLIIQGTRSRAATVAKIADALGVTSEKLLRIVDRPAGEIYAGPESSRLLSPRQRLAMDELIRSFTEEQRNDQSGEPTPPTPLYPVEDADSQDAREEQKTQKKAAKKAPPNIAPDELGHST